MKKINSIHFGPPMLVVGVILGVAVPLLIWLATDFFSWWLCVPGAVVLLVFVVLLLIEIRQDNAKVPYYERNMAESIPFDRSRQTAVIRASICTGEMVASFKDLETGHFTEVMVIHNENEKQRFMDQYGITELKKEY